jgi:hypothetical protein
MWSGGVISGWVVDVKSAVALQIVVKIFVHYANLQKNFQQPRENQSPLILL